MGRIFDLADTVRILDGEVHRSQGELAARWANLGSEYMVFLRAPRPEDPVYVICCTNSRCRLIDCFTRGRLRWEGRPAVLSVTPDFDVAFARGELHAESHMLAVAPFRARQRRAYGRQHGIERALGA